MTIVGSLYIDLGFEARYETSVAAGTHHLDSTTTVNFGYTFGKKP